MRPVQLDHAFIALADPVRRAMLGRLSQGECTVGDLAKPFDLTPPAISRHLRMLERARLVRQRHEGRYRYCVLDPAGLTAVGRWLEFYREFWTGSFDRLDDVLKEIREKAHGTAKRKRK